jgi:hypothetical protein
MRILVKNAFVFDGSVYPVGYLDLSAPLAQQLVSSCLAEAVKVEHKPAGKKTKPPVTDYSLPVKFDREEG